MYITLSEFVLIRLGFGAARLALRVVRLVALVTLWALVVLARLLLRPPADELARVLGRLWGYWRLASLARAEGRPAIRTD